jgi:uncharacterized membrane protein YgdD (TMEM256/DUF423 family)
MPQRFLAFAAVNGFLSVALGAFAAHGLKEAGEGTNYLEVFNTAAEYQMTHALALLLVSMLMYKFSSRYLSTSAWSFSLGLILFPGSLYLLVLLNLPVLGAITPIGGVAFLTGWVSLLLFGIMQKNYGNQT